MPRGGAVGVPAAVASGSSLMGAGGVALARGASGGLFCSANFSVIMLSVVERSLLSWLSSGIGTDTPLMSGAISLCRSSEIFRRRTIGDGFAGATRGRDVSV